MTVGDKKRCTKGPNTNHAQKVRNQCAVIIDRDVAYSNHLFEMASITTLDMKIPFSSNKMASGRCGLNNTLVTSRNSCW